ncbi:haloacid dehalogenase type II [Methylobacterium sp. J-068]|uniref:haloacid dehalogenase type II n=1 Tax=Methylobacterium sp. J-068 TaxID=2836649 RepID=UPI001FBACF15|nr:haloacid dehalogenase type II [Methylobacterium sp. J-068]MCJ2036010.1 haloacid dehalogenase type II [Methylobacterium sp. J-068]
MTFSATPPPDPADVGFDVFGTVVDWRSGIARAAAPFLDGNGIAVDPLTIADEWRALYQPAMEEVHSGRRPWVRLDVLNGENLRTVLTRHGVDVARIAAGELDELNWAWERLDPWPDSVEGLTRLKRRFAIGPLSNGHLAGMMRLARFGGLPWDVIVVAEIARSYKPKPETYLRSAEAVGLPPERIAMVAAHNDDLRAARACGLRTVFVRRPHEHGPAHSTDLAPAERWDVEVESLTEAADALGCP